MNNISKTVLIAVVLAGFGLSGCNRETARADAGNADLVAQGAKIYAVQCASCHGANLEGQPNWRTRMANGRLPAPPHDASGHTWHHPDDVLFAIVKNGVVPPNAPPGYQSDMPAFSGKLKDGEIWAVLAYIKSRWPEDVRKLHDDIEKQAQSR